MRPGLEPSLCKVLFLFLYKGIRVSFGVTLETAARPIHPSFAHREKR